MSASTTDSESVAGPGEVAASNASRGSSASSGLREEYEDLLRYAVVTPLVGGKGRQPNLNASSKQQPSSSAPRPELEISKVESSENSAASQQEQEDHGTPHTRPNLQQPTSSAERPPGLTTPITTPTSVEGTMTPRELHDEEGEGGLGGLSDTRHPMSDPEVAQVAGQMDAWCLDLKRNLLAEFEQSRARLIERYQAELHKERQQHLQQIRQLQEEVERCKELMFTYEQSITRKDQVIANITGAIQKQKDKVELQQCFSNWKIRHYDQARQSFTSSLAEHHYTNQLKSRIFTAWFGTIRGRWKQRLEKACQAKAQEMCVQLTNEYDERLLVVQRSLDESRAEVVQLKAERQLCEENMKKAFMRGVCALNLEAMSVFRTREPAVETGNHHGDAANGDSAASSGAQTPDQHQAGSSSSLPPKPIFVTATSNGHLHSNTRASKPSMVTMAPPRSTSGRKGQSSKGPPIVVERHTST